MINVNEILKNHCGTMPAKMPVTSDSHIKAAIKEIVEEVLKEAGKIANEWENSGELKPIILDVAKQVNYK